MHAVSVQIICHGRSDHIIYGPPPTKGECTVYQILSLVFVLCFVTAGQPCHQCYTLPRLLPISLHLLVVCHLSQKLLLRYLVLRNHGCSRKKPCNWRQHLLVRQIESVLILGNRRRCLNCPRRLPVVHESLAWLDRPIACMTARLRCMEFRNPWTERPNEYQSCALTMQSLSLSLISLVSLRTCWFCCCCHPSDPENPTKLATTIATSWLLPAFGMSINYKPRYLLPLPCLGAGGRGGNLATGRPWPRGRVGSSAFRSNPYGA